MDFFDVQNEKFYDFLNETFKINKYTKWEDIAKNITLLKVKLTYKFFSKLFERNYPYYSELEKSKDSFSSIHYGAIKANKIIDEVVRFSLYTDKIIVFHPLQNPSVTNQKKDPRKNPKYWLPDFLDSLYFYIVIQKWVKAGIVKLIINPYEYDLHVRNKIDEKARVRFENTNKEHFFDIAKDSIIDDFLVDQFAVHYKGKSQDYIFESLLKMDSPRFKKSEAADFSKKIAIAAPKSNPLYNKIGINLEGNSSMLHTTKSGGPLESIILISEKTNSNIYTASETNWYQVKEYGLDDFWLKVNHLYSKIPLTFLNSVDTNFALEMRLEDRLSGVRQELKKIYSELKEIKIDEFNETKIRFLQEGFLEELKKAESEWKYIKKKVELSRKYWITANVGIPLLTNVTEFSILPMAIGSIAWLLNNEKSSKENEKLFRSRNPISVYVDLQNKRQNFLTELRNCII